MKKYKTALITGGCQRIGSSISKSLAKMVSMLFNTTIQRENKNKS